MKSALKPRIGKRILEEVVQVWLSVMSESPDLIDCDNGNIYFSFDLTPAIGNRTAYETFRNRL